MKFETTANLSQKSVENLIKNLNNYSKELQESKKYILTALAEYTKERAKYYLETSILHPELSTGRLSESIDIEYYSEEYAKVYTDMYYSAYVEFGTGVRGMQSGYDTSMFGEIPYNDQYLAGQSAHRYMYNAVLDLKQNYITIAERVLKERGLI